MSDVFSIIKSIGIVPVIKLENPKDSLLLGKALVEGGLLAAEVTFRTKSAAESIALLKKEFPDLATGAGTVLTIEQAEAAIAAGASYIVTPGFNPRIVDFCLSKGMPVMPGINSPSQVEQGLERGLKLLKFFPAEASGGVKMLKALHGPYADVAFVPTGGIDASNVESYLQLSYVAAIGGSWMVKEDLIAAGNYQKITALCAEAVALVKRVRGPRLA
ncbi:MAG: bifunctional 4-hydroxy-2-oxoglutarate aldolase/2-dehydro-3-deoxy-phosphogluconate aldolase [Spirochaetia bacterium]|jgi:2-dehydro-3-deoxyphosphogluconate aldolase/(4S)-4-hydroxy-2-oxoglutarate aldolase|nr:bifunctional 4-hydroxy-2-oxoglutarate aldolase/2-dehydro-3-deoxy-phosphogluconate aldolase [Spirochaetia bacterium]